MIISASFLQHFSEIGRVFFRGSMTAIHTSRLYNSTVIFSKRRKVQYVKRCNFYKPKFVRVMFVTSN